jgi:hypothetical protein
MGMGQDGPAMAHWKRWSNRPLTPSRQATLTVLLMGQACRRYVLSDGVPRRQSRAVAGLRGEIHEDSVRSAIRNLGDDKWQPVVAARDGNVGSRGHWRNLDQVEDVSMDAIVI